MEKIEMPNSPKELEVFWKITDILNSLPKKKATKVFEKIKKKWLPKP